MVSKASDDLPERESPVNTTSLSRGIVRSMPFRLCSRAPRIEITRCGVSKSLSSEPDEAREVVFAAGLEGDLGGGRKGGPTMNVSRTPYVARRAAHCTPCPAYRGLFSTGLDYDA